MSRAKIFLSEERGCDENEWYRRYSTFNFGKYFNEYKHPFQTLYLLNDETIAAGHSADFTIDQTSYILVLPVAGSVLCKINGTIESIVHIGQLCLITAFKNDVIQFENGYESDLINFIQIWISVDDIKNSKVNRIFNFVLDENKNSLIKITNDFPEEEPLVSIGMFTGRNDANYELQNKSNDLFVFVIQGAFEVEGRLLHSRDGLALWNGLHQIELEALSNDAIILIIELNGTKPD